MPAMHPHQRCCDLASAEIARFAAVIRGATRQWQSTDAATQMTGDRSLMVHWQRHAVIT